MLHHQAFFAAQIALTGLPLVLFLAFATTTLLVSITTCVLLGLLAALAFTFFVVGFALILVVPTIFLASCSATFIFIWGFVGYIILRRLNEGQALDKRGTKVGDNLQRLTGGRAGSLGLWIGGGAGNDAELKPITLDQTSAAKSHVGSDWEKNLGGASYEGNGGPVHAVNGAQEWEEKWSNSAKEESKVPDVDNPFEILKAASLIPYFPKNIANNMSRKRQHHEAGSISFRSVYLFLQSLFFLRTFISLVVRTLYVDEFRSNLVVLPLSLVCFTSQRCLNRTSPAPHRIAFVLT